MPFSIRPYQRFPVHCSVTYNAGPFQGQGTMWNLSCIGWRLSGDLPMRPGEPLSLTVTLMAARFVDEHVVKKGVCHANRPWVGSTVGNEMIHT